MRAVLFGRDAEPTRESRQVVRSTTCQWVEAQLRAEELAS